MTRGRLTQSLVQAGRPQPPRPNRPQRRTNYFVGSFPLETGCNSRKENLSLTGLPGSCTEECFAVFSFLFIHGCVCVITWCDEADVFMLFFVCFFFFLFFLVRQFSSLMKKKKEEMSGDDFQIMSSWELNMLFLKC